MKRRKSNDYGKVITLAYFYRYGWIALAGLTVALFRTYAGFCLAICGFFFAASAHTLIGYRLGWKHIYCAMQNAYHQEMTPDDIRWTQIRKCDIYGSALIYTAIGAVLLYFTVQKYM